MKIGRSGYYTLHALVCPAVRTLRIAVFAARAVAVFAVATALIMPPPVVSPPLFRVTLEVKHEAVRVVDRRWLDSTFRTLLVPRTTQLGDALGKVHPDAAVINEHILHLEVRLLCRAAVLELDECVLQAFASLSASDAPSCPLLPHNW